MVEECWALVVPKITWVKEKVGLGNTVLDVGCADAVMWEKSPFKVTLLDKEVRTGAEPCHPDIVADAENIPLDDNSYDIVCLCEILEHLPDPLIAIKEAMRVARLKVIITVPWEALWHKVHLPFTNPGHIHYFIPQTFKEVLEKTGKPTWMQIFSWEQMVWIGAEIYGVG